MNKIKILPDSVSNKIAAGEVIERPASVIKELLENSLDAGAKHISVSISGAGIKSISVSDDGCGMSYDDAFLCIEPHATSKIRDADDLNSISTLGFRGEALPSIASVSKFRLRTRTEDSAEGTEITVDGGRVTNCEPAGCAKGTEILVKELFFNVPARRKFLSSPEAEEKRVVEMLYTLAIANFAVSFEFSSEGKELFNSPGDDLPDSRLISFFGKSFFENLLPVEFEESGIKISGFTAKHGFSRSSRREQRIFVNGRPADSAVIYSGIKDAYASLTPHGRFPPIIILVHVNLIGCFLIIFKIN
nr:DNA mismatch repair endonuclease MutL [Victivallales bacterium]